MLNTFLLDLEYNSLELFATKQYEYKWQVIKFVAKTDSSSKMTTNEHEQMTRIQLGSLTDN